MFQLYYTLKISIVAHRSLLYSLQLLTFHSTAICYSFPRFLVIDVHFPPPRSPSQGFKNYNLWRFRLSNWFYPYYTKQVRWKAKFVLIFLNKLNNWLYLPIFSVIDIRFNLSSVYICFSTFNCRKPNRQCPVIPILKLMHLKLHVLILSGAQ